MSNITDDQMMQMLSTTKEYTMVLLKYGPNATREDARAIIWEHGRRNFGLREEGKIAIVGPVTAEMDIVGLYVFNTGVDEAKKIMEEDPGVKGGIFTFTAYPIKSFPGDKLGA
jgi:hypothetical protein